MTLVLGNRAIENDFPTEFVSALAEHESWRKELYRPTYYIHKWWARRLGSVFRSIIISSCVGKEEDVASLFYESIRFNDKVIFDPFMGSGTIVGEAAKLGCKVIGKDINPVATNMVKAFFPAYSKTEIEAIFAKLNATAGKKIRSLYSASYADGKKGQVMYYFWVRTVQCPRCAHTIDLFKKRIFISHAYPKRHPGSQSICPKCDEINITRFNDTKVYCKFCREPYNPQIGSVQESGVSCHNCSSKFQLLEVLRSTGKPLGAKMYAKMVLLNDRRKVVERINEQDLESLGVAEKIMADLRYLIPHVEIREGHNTHQVLNYNYRFWHEMFNARQLASIAILVSEIAKIEDNDIKRLFAFLLSGVLEFNNMFTSFKGEGTGAVRHMFAHHILKPELTPLEANLWGTTKSSGSFSTLFNKRIMRALEYKDNPFELKIIQKRGKVKQEKITNLSRPLNMKVVNDFNSFLTQESVYLKTGNSAFTDIKSATVDLVITDPPFFDNVHYSELADFFHVWLRVMLKGDTDMASETTRMPDEVQSNNVDEFSSKLAAVFSECNRVLKDDGLLIFTYHHSRVEGWTSVYKAIRYAGFFIVITHAVKSEMAVSIPVQQAREPINYDLIIVCRKSNVSSARRTPDLEKCASNTVVVVRKLRAAHLKVSRGDIRVIMMGNIMSQACSINSIEEEVRFMNSSEPDIERVVGSMDDVR